MAKRYFKDGRLMCSLTDEIAESKQVNNTQFNDPKFKHDKFKFNGSGRNQNHNGCNNKEKHIPHIKVLEQRVLKSIIGQDEQVRKIITAIYRSIYFKTIKSNVLIIGKSGTGKTETIKQVAKRLNIPYTIEDATKYTKEGYYGADVSEMVYNLLQNVNFDIEKAKKGIIIIDEIDKKVSGEHESDISGEDVLKSLLKIVEGTIIKVDISDSDVYQEVIDFDTSDLTIIFMGAFAGLDKIRNKRLGTNAIGFANSINHDNESNGSKSAFLKEDLIKFGMPEEFIGRIDTIIEMKHLTKTDLAKILKSSELSIFRRYQKELKQKGVLLSYDGKLFELIAEASMALNTGARELSNTVNYIFENIIYDIMANPGRYSKCEMSLDIVRDNTKYKLL